MKEVHVKNTCVHECGVEALRLRKKRVKTLSWRRNKYYVKVMTARKKHALAILQLVLCLSIMLSICANSFQASSYIEDACGPLSEYINSEEVQSSDAAAVVPDDATSVCIANQICTSHKSAFEGSVYIDDTRGV